MSLTSHGLRLNTVLHKALESVCRNDGFEPDAIVLYLSEQDDTYIDKQMYSDIPNLEIRITDNYKSHKKYTALSEREFDNDFVWVIDDDLSYHPDNWNIFERSYNTLFENTVYSFGIKNICFPFVRNAQFISEVGLYENGFIIYSGRGTIFPPNTMRLELSDIREAYSVSPTCDDTYCSAYMVARGVRVFNMTDGKVKNYDCLKMPFGASTLFNYNRSKMSKHIRDNFAHFGLYVD